MSAPHWLGLLGAGLLPGTEPTREAPLLPGSSPLLLWLPGVARVHLIVEISDNTLLKTWTGNKTNTELKMLQRSDIKPNGRSCTPRRLEGNDLLCQQVGGNQFQITSQESALGLFYIGFASRKYEADSRLSPCALLVPGENKLVGDLLVLGGATLYGISNVWEEYIIRTRSRVEFLGMIGLFGAFFSGIQL